MKKVGCNAISELKIVKVDFFFVLMNGSWLKWFKVFKVFENIKE